ncbi:hypothetical protein D3C73_887660 [compost metagenome]
MSILLAGFVIITGILNQQHGCILKQVQHDLPRFTEYTPREDLITFSFELIPGQLDNAVTLCPVIRKQGQILIDFSRYGFVAEGYSL